MKRNIFISILIILIICFLSIGAFALYTSPGQSFLKKYLNIEVTRDSNTINIVDRSNQYNLLYSLNLQNSLKPECNWESTEINWNFPADNKLNVYKTSHSTISIDPKNPEIEITKYDSISETIEGFYSSNAEIEENLIFDYEPSIFSDVKITYEKIPLYSSTNNKKILNTNLGVWRNSEGKYVAGLYEITNAFKEFQIEEKPNFSFIPKLEEQIKQDIQATNLKFLNHEFLCENKSIDKSEIESIEIVYINKEEYLIPTYKINGSFEIENKIFQWSALIDPIDYAKLDYTIYSEEENNQTFVPKPYIQEVILEDKKYTVRGYLPNKLSLHEKNEVIRLEDIEIELIATIKTGEYYWGERRAALQNEIAESLEVKSNGEFNFSFSHDNFWKVEKVFYEDDDRNEIEPYHSSEKEIDREEIDNWFQIKVCSKFKGKEYCGNQSNRVHLY